MRILAIADIHGVPVIYEWLVNRAVSADAIILAGDLLDADLPPNQQKQAQKIAGQLRESVVPVLYIKIGGGGTPHLLHPVQPEPRKNATDEPVAKTLQVGDIGLRLTRKGARHSSTRSAANRKMPLSTRYRRKQHKIGRDTI